MEWQSVIKFRFCTHVDPISNPWIRAPSRVREKNRQSDFIKFVTTPLPFLSSSRFYRIVNPTIGRFTTVKSGFLLRRPTCGTLTRYIYLSMCTRLRMHIEIVAKVIYTRLFSHIYCIISKHLYITFVSYC